MNRICVWFLVFSAMQAGLGVVDQVPLQVVPNGIESVNGSDTTMGCTTSLITFGGVTYCGTFTKNGHISYLVDANSPIINTSTSDWASQLVTVRKSGATTPLPFDHVLLTFDFNQPVTLASIQLDLFVCPEWNIGAPNVIVFADNTSTLNLSSEATLIQNYTSHAVSSCDSFSTLHIPLQEQFKYAAYYTWHIVVAFSAQSDIEWVHVSEVRFLDLVTDSESTQSPRSTEAIILPTETSAIPTFPGDDKPLLSTEVPTPSTTTCIVTLGSSRNGPTTPSPNEYGCTASIPTKSPSSTSTSHSIIGLIVGLAGAVILLILVIVITTVVLVLVRCQKFSSIRELSDDPKVKENDAYGMLQTKILPSHGQFSAPKLTPNVAYGVVQHYPDLDNDGYEQTESIRSYATPFSPSLAI